MVQLQWAQRRQDNLLACKWEVSYLSQFQPQHYFAVASDVYYFQSLKAAKRQLKSQSHQRITQITWKTVLQSGHCFGSIRSFIYPFSNEYLFLHVMPRHTLEVLWPANQNLSFFQQSLQTSGKNQFDKSQNTELRIMKSLSFIVVISKQVFVETLDTMIMSKRTV